jgi:hypothetical protein
MITKSKGGGEEHTTVIQVLSVIVAIKGYLQFEHVVSL